jgi:H+/Cl- antiporter ClcA
MLGLVRIAASVISVILLLAGYLASQLAALQNTYPAYTQQVDQAPIRWLALLFLFAAIVSCFVPDPDKERGEDL